MHRQLYCKLTTRCLRHGNKTTITVFIVFVHEEMVFGPEQLSLRSWKGVTVDFESVLILGKSMVFNQCIQDFATD